MTGRGAGFCSGYDAPGWANPMPGRGYGAAWGGRGGGQRHRNVFYATGVPGWAHAGYGPAWEAPQGVAGYGRYAEPPSSEQETEFLRQQAEWLKQQLDAIGQRIEELGKEE